jgi:hypothetical protein
MRIREIRQPLLEGGNIFKDASGPLTQRINKTDVPPTIKWIEGVTGVKFPMERWLGTTGRKESSGDLDLAVDSREVNKDALHKKLVDWCVANKLDQREYVRKSGISVHFRAPIRGSAKNGFVQVDFMMTDNPDWMTWSMAADQPSQYKDADRQILLASIAKAMGLRWIAQTGLVTREGNKLVANTPENVVDILFGPNAQPKDMKSVENILARLKNDPEREEKLVDARGSLPHIKFD